LNALAATCSNRAGTGPILVPVTNPEDAPNARSAVRFLRESGAYAPDAEGCMSRILWPLVSNVIRRNKLSNTFGRFPERASGVHWGWDFYARAGTPCFAIADGTIDLVYGHTSDTGSFGRVVVLKFVHASRRLFAAYCHLSGAVVTAGQSVNAGDQIGLTGNSGNAANMHGADEHLHFEIRTSGRPPPGGEPFRLSPLTVFGRCPLYAPIVEP